MFSILLSLLLFSSACFGHQTKDLPRGNTIVSTKIVGGVIVSPAFKYPWMTGLFYGGTSADRQFCGATVIDDTHIMTAAHCTLGTPKTNVLAQVHRQNLAKTPSSENGQVKDIVHMIIHPDYDVEWTNNDIAIWTLDSPLDSITPITLDTTGNLASPGTTVRTMGWGTTSEGGNPSANLLQVDLSIVSNSNCQFDYFGNSNITAQMLCAGTTTGGKDSCQGDSGGPLIVNGDTNPVQVGIVSFGAGCGNRDYPGVYSRVSQFQDFITAALADTTDNCIGVTCQHGGTCYDSIDTYLCGCMDGWVGEHCETSPSSKVGFTTINILFAVVLAIVLSL